MIFRLSTSDIGYCEVILANFISLHRSEVCESVVVNLFVLDVGVTTVDRLDDVRFSFGSNSYFRALAEEQSECYRAVTFFSNNVDSVCSFNDTGEFCICRVNSFVASAIVSAAIESRIFLIQIKFN